MQVGVSFRSMITTTIIISQQCSTFGSSMNDIRISFSFQIIVSSTEGTSTLVDKDGNSCKCVPYYLCDSKNVGNHLSNSSITGHEMLDIR